MPQTDGSIFPSKLLETHSPQGSEHIILHRVPVFTYLWSANLNRSTSSCWVSPKAAWKFKQQDCQFPRGSFYSTQNIGSLTEHTSGEKGLAIDKNGKQVPHEEIK